MTTTPLLPKHRITYDGENIGVYHANKGEGIPRHEHAYAHLTMCHAGSLVVRKEGKEHTMTKDSTPVNLKAAEWHEIEALEDGTVFVNIFAEGKT
jgi:quercetin dioxygenase-like cupin family protein